MRFYENKCKRNTLQTLYFLAFLFLLGSFYEWVQYRVWVHYSHALNINAWLFFSR